MASIVFGSPESSDRSNLWSDHAQPVTVPPQLLVAGLLPISNPAPTNMYSMRLCIFFKNVVASGFL